jgi:hypothetical protein
MINIYATIAVNLERRIDLEIPADRLKFPQASDKQRLLRSLLTPEVEEVWDYTAQTRERERVGSSLYNNMTMLRCRTC